MQLINKTALVTGSSSGIGASFAHLLASHKCHLILVARSKSKLEEIATNLRQKHQINVTVIEKDLSKPRSAAELYHEVKQAGLSVDLLINNAGFGKWGKFEDFSLSEYEQMIQLNITSLTELCHLFMTDLRAQPEAGIINVGSTASFMPVPYSGVYGATKSYVLSLSEALVGELRDTKVHVSCLCPSGTASNFNAVANSNNSTDNSSEDLMSSDEVAKIGLDAFQKGKHYVVTGRKSQITLMKFLSRRKVIDMIANYWKKRIGL